MSLFFGSVRDTYTSRIWEVSPEWSYISRLQERYPISDPLKDRIEAVHLLVKKDAYSLEEREKVSRLFQDLQSDSSLMYSLKGLVDGIDESTALTLHEMAVPLDGEALVDKFQAILENRASVQLTPQEFGLILFSPNILKLIEEAESQGVDGLASWKEKWTLIEKLSHHKLIQDASRRCSEMIQDGTVFISDRETYYAMRGISLRNLSMIDLDGAIRHVLFGVPAHVGVLIRKDGELCLSHIAGDPGYHSVRPKPMPFFTSFSLLFKFNIDPLMPDGLDAERKEEIQQLFFQNYKDLVLVERPKIPLAGLSRLMQGYLGGTKSISEPTQNRFQFTDDHPELCTGYVAKILALAVENTNRQLGAHEQLRSPFDRHTNVENLTIPQLAGHLKREKILELQPRDPLLSSLLQPPERLEAFWESL